jgi:hypothetical protein
MTKEQYIEKWIDKYMDDHPDEKISDFKALEEQADCAWYDEQVDHGEKTEYDLTAEQEKVAQEARKGMARAVNAYGKQVKRERKPNEDKRFIIAVLHEAMQATGEHAPLGDGGTVVNPERQIDFELNGVKYSLTLTAHRPPKTK